ncbi:alkaline phosphatase PhoX [Kaarinaea lacus]
MPGCTENAAINTQNGVLKLGMGSLSTIVVLLILFCSLTSCSQTETTSRNQRPIAEAMLVPNTVYADKIKITVLKTAGEKASASSNYRMVGMGDGIGVYSEDNKIIAVMNHELSESQGGAFISKWTLDSNTHAVTAGERLSKEIFFYNKKNSAQAGMSGYEKANGVISRLCSADLPSPTALAYTENGKHYGTNETIFFSGEETNTSFTSSESRQGRAFAHMLSGDFTGASYELPAMGRMAFENIVLNPYSQKKTIAVLMDDAKNKTHTTPWDELSIVDKELIKLNPPSELYVYIGEKQSGGNHPLERAGLTNGYVYGVRVLDGQCATDDAICRSTPNAEVRNIWLQGNELTAFELRKIDVPINDEDGHLFQLEAYKNGITQFLRLEDGAWDPRPGHENDYYFVTTDYFKGNSRLYKLTFNDISQPEQGGVISILINGNREQEPLVMMDNITVDPWGRIFIQEDPGKDSRLAKIWMYDTNTGDIKEIAKHNPKFFDKDAGSSDFLTTNEESSGIVQAFHTLGEGWYLLNVQAHASHDDSAIVQHGQFLKMYVPKEL